jgi:hypothetical protein
MIFGGYLPGENFPPVPFLKLIPRISSSLTHLGLKIIIFARMLVQTGPSVANFWLD